MIQQGAPVAVIIVSVLSAFFVDFRQGATKKGSVKKNMKYSNILRKTVTSILALSMAVTSVPVPVLASPSVPEAPVLTPIFENQDSGTRIDLLTFTDFHGHTARGSANDNDPGAPLFVAYAEMLRAQNPNPNNVFFMAGGDEFHGYALANYHQGENAVAMFDYLTRYQEFNLHVALGNHEFSHGTGRAYTLGEQVTLLAADLFYQSEEEMPAGYTPSTDFGERPAFVQPYDVIEFPDHDITIGVIGLMNTGMRNLVAGGLPQFDMRMIQASAPQEYKDAIHAYIRHLREYHGVSAVVAATHKGGMSGPIDYLAQHFDFDAILGGHAHATIAREAHGTPILEPGFHGRNIGRFSFYFNEDGTLDNTTGWMTPQNAIRDFAPREAGEFGILGAHAGHPDFPRYAHHYDRMTEILEPLIEEAEVHFGAELGPVGIYFNNQDGRNLWVTRLVLDYVRDRFEDDSIIFLSNNGGWRNTGMWPRNANDPVYRREIYTTMPFYDAILIHEMYGADVITMLNSASANQLTGVHGSQNAWYNTATGQRFTPYGHGEPNAQTYIVASRHHVFNQDTDTWRFPGNPGGDRANMHIVREPYVMMQTTADERNPLEVRSSFLERAGSDNSTWRMNGATMLRDAIETVTNNRGDLGLDAISVELAVSAEGNGTAAITAPFAPNDQTRNVNIPSTRVTVTATPDNGVDFLGWFNDEILVSESTSHTFTILENTDLVARFEGEAVIEAPTQTETISVREARNTPIGEEITVRGIVTNFYETTVNNNNTFFLQDVDGTDAFSGIHVRIGSGNTNVGTGAAGARYYVGHLVEVTGIRQFPTATNGFQGVDNITINSATADITIIERNVQLPEVVAVDLNDLVTAGGQSRPFSSMMISLNEPVQVTGETNGPGGTNHRVRGIDWTTAGDLGGNTVIINPLPPGINAGDWVQVNRANVHWWAGRNEIQLRGIELGDFVLVDAPVMETPEIPDEDEISNEGLRIDLLTFTDFHGHTARASANDNDPGAPLFVAYAEMLRAQNPNPDNVFFLGGGDEFHGYALANYHMGANSIAMFDYLTRNQEFDMHIALGNHEFSHGIGRAYELGNYVTLLAADIFYRSEDDMPAGFAPSTGYGERPSFVRPYDIIEFPDHDITIGVVGLMNTGMRNLVSGGLAQFDLRMIQASAPQAYKDAIHAYIRRLREYHGVSAVVAATHKGGMSGPIDYLAQHFDFDAILGGHAHATIARESFGTPILEPGFHGRNIGRFSFYFNEEGELNNTTAWMTPQNAIRDFAPRAEGEFGVLGAHGGHPDFPRYAHHYEAMTNILQPLIDEAEVHFGAELGLVGMYFGNQNYRNLWVTQLNLDYITTRLDDPTIIAVSNNGGWRNTGMWPRNPESPVYRREIYTTMPFNNLILIHQMYGRDLNLLLDGMTNNQRTGVHGSTGAWYITATGQRITPYGHGHPDARIYQVSGSNHTFMQTNDLWRFPGNPGGDRAGMHVISEPEVLMVPTAYEADPREDFSSFIERASTDTSVWAMNGARMLRDALEISTVLRGELPLEDFASELTVQGNGSGTVMIASPYAPADRTRNININNTRMTVTATPLARAPFMGWFNVGDASHATPRATTLSYSFTITENTALEARFADADTTIVDYELQAALAQLTALIETAAHLEEAEFTSESWATLQAALVLANEATQSSNVGIVRLATAVLSEAIEALEEPLDDEDINYEEPNEDDDKNDEDDAVDEDEIELDTPAIEPDYVIVNALAELQRLIDSIHEKGLVSADFTALSWTEFSTAMHIATFIVENGYTLFIIEEAINQLNNAVANLVFVFGEDENNFTTYTPEMRPTPEVDEDDVMEDDFRYIEVDGVTPTMPYLPQLPDNEEVVTEGERPTTPQRPSRPSQPSTQERPDSNRPDVNLPATGGTLSTLAPLAGAGLIGLAIAAKKFKK